MNKKDKLKFKTLANEAISVQQFLSKFLGVNVRSLKLRDVTHKDLKYLFPHLKNTSYDQILSDPKMIYSGDVVLVMDCYNNIVPYCVDKQKIGQNLISDIIEDDDWNNIQPEEWTMKEEIPNIKDYDLDSLSLYELVQLMNIFSATQQMAYYHAVRRVIVWRENSKKRNHISLEKAKRKELKRMKKNDNRGGYND